MVSPSLDYKDSKGSLALLWHSNAMAVDEAKYGFLQYL